MVRNGMVDAVRRDIVWEERCYTVGQLQCNAVQYLRCAVVRFYTVQCDAVR